MGSQENKLINLYIEFGDGLRDLEERFYTMIPMYHRDYTDSPEDFAHEITYKRYCKGWTKEKRLKTPYILWKTWSIHTLILMIQIIWKTPIWNG